MRRSAPSYLLVRHRRHFIRLRVPADLVARLGRCEIVRALGTSDGWLARAIASRLALRLPRLWVIMREARLSEVELRKLADDWLWREVDREWAVLQSGAYGRIVEPSPEDIESGRDLNAELFARHAFHIEETLRDISAPKRSRPMLGVAEDLLTQAGYPDAAKGRERHVLSLMLLERCLMLQDSKQEWALGNPNHLPPPIAEAPRPDTLPSQPADTSPAAAGNSRALRTAIDLFIATMRQHGATEKHVKDATVDFKALLEIFGEGCPVGKIGKAEAGRALEALRSLPPGFRQREDLAGRSLVEKAEHARKLGLSPMHHRTVNSYLARWRKLFDQEIAAGQINDNPFLKKRATPMGRVPKQERTLTIEELEVLFSCPLFQGARNDKHRYDPGCHLVSDWMFWAPLIALMSGARIGEIALLRPCDIRVEHGVEVFDFNEEGAKRLKNRGTARKIPIHSHLLKLGVLRLAEHRRANGHATLLPEMPKPILGDAGAPASKWMSERLLPRLKLKTRAGLGFHSFRHTLKTLMRAAHVPVDISNEICGHDERTSGVAAAYGLVPIEGMAKALESITLPEAVLRIPLRSSGEPPAQASSIEPT